MVRKTKKRIDWLEDISIRATQWVGTPTSILIHTVLFIGIFGLRIFGIATSDILLILTTAVSLEAIYLAIFIQMTVNKNTQSLEEVEEDIDEMQEDIEDLEEEAEEDDQNDSKTKVSLGKIENGLQKLLNEIDDLKRRNKERSL